MQRTFLAVKPDGVQRGLCGEIIRRFEQRGFRLVAAKFIQVTMATAASAAGAVAVTMMRQNLVEVMGLECPRLLWKRDFVLFVGRRLRST